MDVAHLVHGHVIDVGASFSVSGSNDGISRSVTATFREGSPGESLVVNRRLRGTQRDLFEVEPDDEDAIVPLELELDWRVGEQARSLRLPLTRRGGLSSAILRVEPGRPQRELPPIHFITTEGLTRDRVVALFDETVLTPDEQTVLQALRTIEPDIERIASIGSSRRYASDTRGGLAMLVDGRRVPVGSMGDGIWRLLGIALALVRSSGGGTLLIDEIDTGLHYSVLTDMWRLVFETARRLDVQVFATTHSRDCYEALAAVAEAGRHEISLQRIERGKPKAIVFTEAEIQQAAERGIEIR
ncbi:ATP-binding protein [Myxococcota bacterium]|nr:ATP-binding protein [Myxococcota bacterium]